MEPFETLDKRFAAYTIPIVFLEKLHTGLRWAEGPVYFADQRCLLFSDLPNNRILRLDEQTSQVTIFRRRFEFLQRQHARPAGPPRHLRTSRPSGDPHRIRRDHHRPRRQLRGQAPQFAQRRGREVGRHGLVHRSDLRHQRRIRGRQGGERDRKLQRLSLRPAATAVCASSSTTSGARTASPSRPTRSCSTSPIPASGRIRTGRTTSALSRSARRQAWQQPRARRSHPREFRTASASISTAISGPAPATAFNASRPAATSSAKFPFRKRSPMSASADRRATACSSAGTRRSTPFM